MGVVVRVTLEGAVRSISPTDPISAGMLTGAGFITLKDIKLVGLQE